MKPIQFAQSLWETNLDTLKRVDLLLLLLLIALVSIGLIMVSSASMEHAKDLYGSEFHLVKRQLVYLCLAFSVASVVFFVPMSWWEKNGWVFLFAGFSVLVLVLIPGIGREVNGSYRWISLGPINLQASELMKLFLLIYMAGYLVRRQDEVREQWKGFLKPMTVLFFVIVLLLMEPDFGAVVVIMAAVLGMLFLGGLKLTQFLIMIAVSGVGAAGIIWSSPYRMKRLVAYLNPWEDPFGSGYQLTQSLIAIGRGEWFGVGLGNSLQKQFYLPEAHTDFIFAILAEETGLIGVLLLLALYGFFIIKILLIGKHSEKVGNFFAAYICYGVGLLLSAQIFINVGVNSGLLPTKGLTLPFLSYGGSSLIVCCAFLALVLRASSEAYGKEVIKVEAKKTIKNAGKKLKKKPLPDKKKAQPKLNNRKGSVIHA